MRTGEMQELSEEGSRRTVMRDCLINTGKDVEAMGVDDMGKGRGDRRRRMYPFCTVQRWSDERHVIHQPCDRWLRT